MCVHLSKELWDRHKDRLTELVKEDRAAVADELWKLDAETDWNTVGVMKSAGGTEQLIDELLASVEARAAYEARELVPA